MSTVRTPRNAVAERRDIERWRNRPLQTSSHTRCDFCGNLRQDPDVTVREYGTMKMRSCGRCYAAAVRKEDEETLRVIQAAGMVC